MCFLFIVFICGNTVSTIIVLRGLMTTRRMFWWPRPLSNRECVAVYTRSLCDPKEENRIKKLSTLQPNPLNTNFKKISFLNYMNHVSIYKINNRGKTRKGVYTL